MAQPPRDDHRRAKRDQQQRAGDARTGDFEPAAVVHEDAREELPRIELAQQHADAAAEADRRVGRVAEVVADDAEVARRVRELVDDRGDPQHDAQRNADSAPPPERAPGLRVAAGTRCARCRGSPTSTSPPINPRYEMCVCAQSEPANTATGSIARSSASTDHTASTNTNHHSTGRYGFHGSVRRYAPYARINTASTAAIASSTARRRAAAPSTARARSPRCRARRSTRTTRTTEPPNSFHTGHNA